MNTKRLLRFVISGGCAAFVEYATFFFFVHFLNIQVILAQPLSFSCGVITSYILNKFWVFGHGMKNVKRIELVLFGSLAMFNLFFTTVLMEVSVYLLHIQPLIVKIILMGCVAVWNYVIFNKIIFRSSASS